ncbi:hypothetical protein VS877_22530, partial [Salmonella enterica subsp. enterica serovar Paratyphi A]|nr:hypothetical protein [Salmonella enterica subsp. enterica serovar Paratyphi A]
LDNAKERPRYGVGASLPGWIRNGQHIGRADKMSRRDLSPMPTLDNAKERPRYGVGASLPGWIRNGQHIGRADKMS